MKITVKRKDLRCRRKQRTVYVLQTLINHPKEWVDFNWAGSMPRAKERYRSDEFMFRHGQSAQRIVRRVDVVVDVRRVNLEKSNAYLPF